MAMKRPGPYVPLSAYYADDEKIMEAGEDAELLYIRMLAYAARTPRTDGWISDRVVQSRLGILPRESGNGAGNVPGTDAGSRSGRLRDVGLIERDGSGWRLVAWLKWNRSTEEIARERQRDVRRKNATTSTGTGTGPGTDAGTDAGTGAGIPPPIRQADTDTDTDTDRTTTTLVSATLTSENFANTDGTPPTPNKPRKTPTNAALEDGFEQWWAQYPRKVAKQKAVESWRGAMRKRDVTPDVLTDGLRRYLPAWQNKPLDLIPHASTWLHQERWNDVVEHRGARMTTARNGADLPDGW